MEAERRGLPVTGTLGVLANAHLAGLLDFEQAMVELRQTNFYVSDEVVERVRQDIARMNGRTAI
jgi:predicted nucleic acid-binding protein